MFVYLSKKIAIPNNFRLNSISWNQKEGYIAVGGEDGLLKVLRVDASSSGTNSGEKSRSLVAPSNLSMNQTLEGHNGHVQVVTWNEQHQKLTSSDQNGVIIVWMLYKGSWYEEMINNRNKSVVKGMAWSQDGLKICIVYEDGAVIVGSVDGNRIWGKELKNVSLSSVQWSPDGKLLLFGLKNGEVHLYDDQGVFLTKLVTAPSSVVGGAAGQTETIVTLQWYNGRNGYVAADCPALAICYRNGRVVLMRDTNDDNPIVMETGMKAASWCCWNSQGSILAVTGWTTNGETKDTNVVRFYTPLGKCMRTLKVPGREVTCCAWEGGSLRVALSVDSHIYFANVRLDYKWTYFGRTVVFANEKMTNDGICVRFWNTKSNTCCAKYVRALISVASHGEHCVLCVRSDLTRDSEQYALLVCNTIGTPVDTKFIDFEPLWVSMTNSIVVAASKNNFLLWTYRTPSNSVVRVERNERSRRDKIYHVDETPTGATEVIQDLDKDRSFETPINTKPTMDPICCLAASEKILLIGRESGMIQRYSWPRVTLTSRYNVGCRLDKIAINCDSSRVSILDTAGILSMLDVDADSRKTSDLSSDAAPNASPTPTLTTNATRDNNNDDDDDDGGGGGGGGDGGGGGGGGDGGGDASKKFERKDVWAMCWARDNPDLLAIMEKTRMYVLRGFDPEEPLSCSGYICSFQDLEIRCVLLDDLMRKPDEAKPELLLDLEVKSLRDTRELLAKVGLREANNFIQDNPHPRLWRLLAESALDKLDLETAESAMVRCTDYLGVQLIKRLRNLHSEQLKRAEVAAYLGNYDEAEKIYLDMDRRDLAISLRQKLGDYFRVLQLMRMGIGGSDKQMEHAYNQIGEYHAERENWEGAKEYYEKSRNLEKLVECYYKLEDFLQLAATVHQLPDKSPLLKTVGRMLASVGMCPQAVSAYVKYGDLKLAVDTCVRLNHWDQALELARTYKMAQIGELLDKYANHLLSNGKRLQAIEFYKKANYNLEAARLLLDLAEEQAKSRANPIRVKKTYVLAALLIEEHIDNAPAIKAGRSNVLMGLGNENNEEDARLIENAWRGAEAYHFLLLAHRQMYSGSFDAAMKTALRLCEYEDVLEGEDVYCLVALSSAMNRAFATTSKAFVKLESLETIARSTRTEYEDLAVELFSEHSPKDARANAKAECVNCETLVPDWCLACPNCFARFPPCIVSGRPLMDLAGAWICTVCRHHVATERDVVNINACPLCHTTITYM